MLSEALREGLDQALARDKNVFVMGQGVDDPGGMFWDSGLKLVMPSTAYDAKGLLITSIADNNPVIFIEHCWLFKHSGYVPQELYSIPFGKKGLCEEKAKMLLLSGFPAWL
jgi:pyruvate/2-oxoglutarate/acetoin dehydrogenase E1 component